MFGHTDNQQTDNQSAQAQPVFDPSQQPANDQIMHDGSLEEPATVTDQSQAVYSNPIVGYAAPAPQAAPANPNPFGLSSAPAPEPIQKPVFTAPSVPTPPPADSGDLLDIKQKALEQLSPLVNHLEQSPEEKFKTTMMMIQASDDQSLLPAAYEAAQAIPDEKTRAQALLDVVNEINYFTQSH